MDEKIREAWRRVIDPEILRRNLTAAALYIAAFEFLRAAVVDWVKDAYTSRLDDKSALNRYQAEVLSLYDKDNAARASLLWLKEKQVIDDKDLRSFRKVKKLRDQLAHKLVRILAEGFPSDLPVLFDEIISLFEKIDRWWTVKVDLPTDPTFAGLSINEQDVVPHSMGLQILRMVALGSNEESKYYLEQLNKRGKAERGIVP